MLSPVGKHFRRKDIHSLGKTKSTLDIYLLQVMKRMGSRVRFLVQTLTLTLTAWMPLVKLLSYVSVFSSTEWIENNDHLSGCCNDSIS